MRIANFGILLLTVMVVTKYVINLNTFGPKDGSFKSGIALDYENIRYEVAELKSRHVNDRLLAFNSLDEFETSLAAYQPVPRSNHFEGSDFQGADVYVESTGAETGSGSDFKEEPLPMDYHNSLVVYDLSNPGNNVIASTFEDVEDDIPLDNGNTIVSGMMQVIPRR